MTSKYNKADFDALPHSIRAKALDIAQRAYQAAACMGHNNPDAYAAKKHDQYLIDYMEGDDSDVNMYDRCPDYALPVQHAFKHR